MITLLYDLVNPGLSDASLSLDCQFEQMIYVHLPEELQILETIRSYTTLFDIRKENPTQALYAKHVIKT